MDLNLFPTTPGLLASLAMRSDHSFGIWMGIYDAHPDLETKQISLLEDVARDYLNGTVFTNRQLLEEITGEGFYSPERENYYLASCASDKVRLKAGELATRLEESNERSAHKD